jgi:beta-N-acetylhexosaminidase
MKKLELQPPGPIIISLESTQLTKQEQQVLTHKNIGGLILFTRNFENKKQITTLINSIRKINPDILIMVDHEGGRVWRFKNEEFFNPGAMQPLGQLYDTNPSLALNTAFNFGKQIASDLLICGIDLNLAPVLDLDHNGISSVIGDRAFHAKPEIVALLAEQFIKGQQAAGMQAVGKHFPGHGAIKADTHTEIAIDSRSYQEITEQDLLIFKLLIDQNALPAVMPAHVVYEQIDPNPAGFSNKWLQDILRNTLGFKGAIISDCLSMKAAQKFIPEPLKSSELNLKLASRALTAGCDLVIFNGLYGKDLFHLLDHLTWETSLEQTIRINSLKAMDCHSEQNPKKLRVT